MRTPSMYYLCYVSLVTVLIEFIEVTHLAFRHCSISVKVVMSHKSELSTAGMTAGYRLRERREREDKDIALAAALQAVEYDDLDQDSPDIDVVERDVIVGDENDDIGGDDEIDDSQIVATDDMQIDESLSTGKDEAAEPVLPVSKKKKKSASLKQAAG